MSWYQNQYPEIIYILSGSNQHGKNELIHPIPLVLSSEDKKNNETHDKISMKGSLACFLSEPL